MYVLYICMYMSPILQHKPCMMYIYLWLLTFHCTHAASQKLPTSSARQTILKRYTLNSHCIFLHNIVVHAQTNCLICMQSLLFMLVLHLFQNLFSVTSNILGDQNEGSWEAITSTVQLRLTQCGPAWLLWVSACRIFHYRPTPIPMLLCPYSIPPRGWRSLLLRTSVLERVPTSLQTTYVGQLHVHQQWLHHTYIYVCTYKCWIHMRRCTSKLHACCHMVL